MGEELAMEDVLRINKLKGINGKNGSINETKRKNQRNDVHESRDQRALRRVRSAPFRSANPGVQNRSSRRIVCNSEQVHMKD